MFGADLRPRIARAGQLGTIAFQAPACRTAIAFDAVPTRQTWSNLASLALCIVKLVP